MKKLFKLNELVYLITDVDQYERMVTGILEEENGYQYRLSLGDRTSWHYGSEIATSKDFKKL